MAGAVGVALIGNLGTWRMIIRGFQQIAAPNPDIEALSQGAFSFLTRWWYTLQGLIKALAGTPLPYSPADWYWIPSRVIAAQGDVEPITNFLLYCPVCRFACPLVCLANNNSGAKLGLFVYSRKLST
jgi:hypothetical protein